jgi:GAF domain-containing protein
MPGQVPTANIRRAPEPGPAGLDGVDGYPHRWFGAFPFTSIGGTDSGSQRGDGFAASLAELAVTMRREGFQDDQRALGVITEGAVAVIPGAEQSAVVVAGDGGVLAARSVHGELPARLLSLQNQLGEGPYLDAVSTTAPVVVADVTTDTRWPEFHRHARDSEVRSVLCTPLAVQSTVLGTLSLVATAPHAFDEQAEALAAVFAAHATLALATLRELRQLIAMAGSRDVIGQAKGILIERHRVDADQAFAILVGASQRSNLKVREVSRQLVATGVLPGPENRPAPALPAD